MPAAPKKLKKDATLFDWVALAVAPAKDLRDYLQFVYCDGDYIVATDGYRIHIAPNNDGLEVGYYCPRTATPVTHIQEKYPDYWRVVPSTDLAPNTTDTQTEFHSVVMKRNIVQIIGVPSYVFEDQLLQATDQRDSVVRFNPKDEHQAIRVDNSDGSLAVIMPVRV